MSNTIALFGSSRRGGNTGQFMDHIAEHVTVDVIDVGTLDISPYDYDHRNRGDDFEPLMTKVLDFDNIIIASPVYWYAVSPPVKVFLDRVSDYLDLPELLESGRRLRGKSAYVVCTSVVDRVPQPFVDSLTDTFAYLGMNFGGVAHANCSDGYSRQRNEAEVIGFARKIGAPRQVRAPA